MQIRPIFLSLCLIVFCISNANGQSNVSFKLSGKDFGVWAFQQHNEICKLIAVNVKSGKLSCYNAKNGKESTKESVDKLTTKKTIFIQADRNDLDIGKDTIITEIASENYYFFKTSGEQILLKPFRTNNNLLKFNKSELMGFMNADQKEYFLTFTSNYMLCIDSIPVVGGRIFSNLDSKLFEYSKLPATRLYVNDSFLVAWSDQDKENMSQDQLAAFLSTDPDDPAIGRDTVILFEYNMNDTNKQQAIIFNAEFRNYNVKVKSVSCGLERKLMGYMVIMQPFGYLPYNEKLPFTAKELEMLNAVIQIKMIDDLNVDRYYEDTYDDFYMGLD